MAVYLPTYNIVYNDPDKAVLGLLEDTSDTYNIAFGDTTTYRGDIIDLTLEQLLQETGISLNGQDDWCYLYFTLNGDIKSLSFKTDKNKTIKDHPDWVENETNQTNLGVDMAIAKGTYTLKLHEIIDASIDGYVLDMERKLVLRAEIPLQVAEISDFFVRYAPIFTTPREILAYALNNPTYIDPDVTTVSKKLYNGYAPIYINENPITEVVV